MHLEFFVDFHQHCEGFIAVHHSQMHIPHGVLHTPPTCYIAIRQGNDDASKGSGKGNKTQIIQYKKIKSCRVQLMSNNLAASISLTCNRLKNLA